MTEVEALRAMTYEQREVVLKVSTLAAEVAFRSLVDALGVSLSDDGVSQITETAIDALAEHLDELVAA